jgi:nickel-dependent lactate racemase
MDRWVDLPWEFWRGGGPFRLTFPSRWAVTVHQMQAVPPLSLPEIEGRLRNPAGKSWEEITAGATSACIAVDDLARPTPGAVLLPLLCRELRRVGVADIAVIIATGCHRPISHAEMVQKVGREVLDSCAVINHNQQYGLEDLGTSLRGTPFHVNALFCQAGVRIVVGSVTPNYMAGYGGGAKLILPGLCGCDTVSVNHALASGTQPGNLNQPMRQDIEELAERVGVDLAVSCVVNGGAVLCDLYAGDVRHSYAQAVARAHPVCLTPVDQPADVLVLNAFPKDNELTQVKNAFNPVFSAPASLVKPGGAIVVTSAAWDGMGYHAMFGSPETLVETHLARMADYVDASLCLFTPRACARRLKPDGDVRICTDWASVRGWLDDRCPAQARVSVLPQAALQLCS